MCLLQLISFGFACVFAFVEFTVMIVYLCICLTFDFVFINVLFLVVCLVLANSLTVPSGFIWYDIKALR